MTRIFIACLILFSTASYAQSSHNRIVSTIEWVDVDLSRINPPLPLTMRAPKGWKDSYETQNIITAQHFCIEIETSHSADDVLTTVDERRKAIEENHLYKLDQMIIDLPDMMYYKVLYRGNPQYHFIVYKLIKGVKYFIHDREGTESFTRHDVEMMLEAANSISAK